MKVKEKAPDKRLRLYTEETEKKILHPDYENRVKLTQVIEDKEVVKVITGRKCTGSKFRFNEKIERQEEILTYSVTRRFVEFKDGSRLSVSPPVFSHLKIDHKIQHEYINYNGVKNKES